MNNDGSGKIQLTSEGVVDVFPVFSPDGTKIAFSRWGFRGDYCDLMIMDADGSNMQRITFSGIPGKREGSFEEPAWSKDGTKIVFTYNEGTTGGTHYAWWIGIMNSDGSDVEALVRGKSPRFCYDDTKILFSTDPDVQGGKQCIVLMNADGTDILILTSGPNDAYPDVSLATHRIIFERNQDVYIMDQDGSNLMSITSDGLSHYPRWSPDEGWIAYSSKKSGNEDIWKQGISLAKARIDLDPDTLNLKSQGKWITTYIELPEGLSVADVDVSSILLNGTVPVDPSAPTAIGDHDKNAVPDLMVKFDRAAVQQYILDNVPIEAKFMTTALTVTGRLSDGTRFQGTDTIKITFPGNYWKIICLEKLGIV
jgi:Tol biopolymer transport system component